MSCCTVERPRAAALAGVVAALAIGCGENDRRRAQDRDRDRVAAIIKGVDNPFFATMRQGLEASARRQKVALRVGTAVDGLQDTAGQASTLEALVEDGAGCYVVNPITPTNLVAPLGHLTPGTPVVNIDSPVDRRAARAAGVTITTYIGPDNEAAGRLAAGAMGRAVGEGARVAIVTGIPDDAGSGQRARGFRQGAARRGFSVTATVAADFDRDRARLAAADLLEADGRLAGVFAVNDQMALGVAEAVRAAGRRGEVAVVGFDGIAEAVEAVERGALTATIAQYPYTLGQLGVEACVASARGRRLPARVDAPVDLVTRHNVARVRRRAPRPVAPFRDPFAAALGG